MNWIVFLVLVGIGAVLFVVYQFFMQREVAYMSLLLYRQGDADTYLKELDSLSGRFFFSKKLRTLMAIDANLMKGDTQELERLFEQASSYSLRSADRFLVLQKEQTYRVSNNEAGEAKVIFEEMKEIYDNKFREKQRKSFEDRLKEADYINTIYVERDGKYAADLMEQARALRDAVPAGMYYVRAAQSYYLKEDRKRALEALKGACEKLKGTSYYSVLNTMYEKKSLEGIMDFKF